MYTIPIIRIGQFVSELRQFVRRTSRFSTVGPELSHRFALRLNDLLRVSAHLWWQRVGQLGD
jgi:hypothetical protein